MRIAQIAPLIESVPPRRYGGTERIVSYLTEELVRAGHEVTLFASGDSLTAAELAPMCEMGLRLSPADADPVVHHLIMLEEVRRRADEFDVLHLHVDLLQFSVLREHRQRCLTTLHGRLDLPVAHRLYATYDDFPLVSISDHQRLPMPPVNWAGTVLHGLPTDLLPFSPKSDGYLAFLGRISPEKRPDRAIEMAVRAGRPLKIAAKVDAADKPYWESVIRPMVEANPNVEFIGEIDERQKADFLGRADALLFPIDWPEPFGLVMIEAMACGTPVIAFPCGSVPEVLQDGLTGYFVTSVEEGAARIGDIGRLDRAVIRRIFERRFSAERMARDYVAIYQRLVGAAPVRMRRPERGLFKAANGSRNAPL
ncbi:glycosyltransferase family 4 protein [Xanthobacter tagetidis]|jgi:glycosyltransferase involved in cell wall biosynthesis|uniref:Glycosyltransferase family 4 protein n=1 Tax=Xanthobacter tagetidis TaxID=60216 RepID=A0A3L7AL80_9HYPH|nr:glycosyltransferase family 4 protein [Xanthobacter tagetidis]MBB6307426.1 glycosyltransferase involved in cell wall biosynthesis [Xanthobacter tagetidis]RLP81017.1 glycosyltransferase family 4 protein [Xanthobacter tagetidis]